MSDSSEIVRQLLGCRSLPGAVRCEEDDGRTFIGPPAPPFGPFPGSTHALDNPSDSNRDANRSSSATATSELLRFFFTSERSCANFVNLNRSKNLK